MNWWENLRNNRLAKFGAMLIANISICCAIAADFIAPYNPYSSQVDGSLLPPTTIHWRNQARGMDRASCLPRDPEPNRYQYRKTGTKY